MITADEIAMRAMAGSLGQPKTENGIPITFIGTDGKPSSNFVQASPCVQVTIANTVTGKAENVWACLDTGADQIYVDIGLISRLALPSVSQLTANSIATPVHQGKISFPPTSIEVATTFVSRTIREHGNGFDVLIGRQVLNAGKFEYDVRGGNRCRFILG